MEEVQKTLGVMNVCWLDLVREVVLELPEHVLLRFLEQGKEPGEVVSEEEGYYGAVVRSGCGHVSKKLRVGWGK